MNFFKSVFSDDWDPPGSESDNNTHRNESQDSPGGPDSPGAWDFSGLIKTLSEKSESIIDIYRRDLQEFGTGLKKEIEVAQGSLETVGHVIDQFGNTVIKGTAQIISQGREAILESDSDSQKISKQRSLNSKRYSRFDAQVRAIQGDASTYTEVPEDLDGYNKWKSEFSLEGKSEEMEGFLRENDAMESVYKRIVPNTVDRETFWYRYYYKVYKLKKAEDVRARLVGRMSREEEELSWDVVDDDDEGDSAEDYDKKIMIMERKGSFGKSQPVESQESELGEKEKELDWDEIEDLGGVDERKETVSGSPSNVDLLKRLSAAAEEELNWDIEEEDDDEPAKA